MLFILSFIWGAWYFLQVHVKMKNLENGTEFVWPKEKFRNRLYQMKEMYNTYEDDDDWEVPEVSLPSHFLMHQENLLKDLA